MNDLHSFAQEVDNEIAHNEELLDAYGRQHEERIRSGRGAFAAIYQGYDHQYDNLYVFNYKLLYVEK